FPIFLIHACFAVARQCYFPDGSPADDSFQPCDPQAANSPCCSLNKPNNRLPDICLVSGLCLAQQGLHAGLVFQNGCTDKEWKAKECPNICPQREYLLVIC